MLGVEAARIGVVADGAVAQTLQDAFGFLGDLAGTGRAIAVAEHDVGPVRATVIIARSADRRHRVTIDQQCPAKLLVGVFQ